MLKVRACKIFLVLVLVTAFLFSSGCWSRREVEDLGIVAALALDKAQGDNIQLSLLMLTPTALAGGQAQQGGGHQEPSIIVTATGTTIAEAARNITKTLPRTIFWPHNRLILIGGDLARSGLDRLDFLTRLRQMRLTTWVMVTPGRAVELLEVKPNLRKTTAEVLADMNQSDISLQVKLFKFMAMLSTEGETPVAPRVDRVGPGQSGTRGQASLRLNGTALFRGDKLIGWMDEKTTRGLLWLRGELDKGIITVPCVEDPKKRLSVRVRDTKRKLEVRQTGESVHIKVKLEADVDLQEIQCRSKLGSPEFVKNIEHHLANEITGRAQMALRQARLLKIDPFGLGKVVKNKAPGYWLRVRNRWGEELARIPVEVVTTVNIRRTGLTENTTKPVL